MTDLVQFSIILIFVGFLFWLANRYPGYDGNLSDATINKLNSEQAALVGVAIFSGLPAHARHLRCVCGGGGGANMTAWAYMVFLSSR